MTDPSGRDLARGQGSAATARAPASSLASALSKLSKWEPEAGHVRVLHVVHGLTAEAGTEIHTRWMIERTRDRVASAVLYPSSTGSGEELEVEPGAWGEVRIRLAPAEGRAAPMIRGSPATLRDPRVEGLFAEIVSATRTRVVHFQHTAGFGTLRLPVVAREAGAQTVLTLRDFYLLCAEPHLARPTGRMCGKLALEGSADCAACLAAKTKGRGRLPEHGSFASERKALALEALEAADAIVSPSRFMHEHFRAACGETIAAKIRVIPHGTPPFASRASWRPHEGLRIAFLGRLNRLKGRRVLLEIASRMRREAVRFRVVGDHGRRPWPFGFRGLELTGPYSHEEIPGRLADVDAVILPSEVHESFCLTLDEAYRAGVPVIASRAGAIAERVRHEETGLLVDPGDVDGFVAAIRRLSREPELLARLRRTVAGLSLRSADDDAADYASLYRELAH